jgi:hypothetical protein
MIVDLSRSDVIPTFTNPQQFINKINKDLYKKVEVVPDWNGSKETGMDESGIYFDDIVKIEACKLTFKNEELYLKDGSYYEEIYDKEKQNWTLAGKKTKRKVYDGYGICYLSPNQDAWVLLKRMRSLDIAVFAVETILSLNNDKLRNF